MIDHTVLTNPDHTGDPYQIKKLHGIVDILLAALPIIVIGYIGTKLGTGTFWGGALVTLAYGISILVAWIILKNRGTGWREFGLARPRNWLRTILLAASTVAACILVSVVLQFILSNLVGSQAAIDQSRFNPLAGNLPVFLLMLVFAWTTIAFGEEMFFRAFLINRLGVIFEGTQLQWPLAAITSAIIFGLAHYLAEGPLGIVTNGLLGLVLAVAYLRSGRNLWVTIFAHALLNTMRFTFLFMSGL